MVLTSYLLAKQECKPQAKKYKEENQTALYLK